MISIDAGSYGILPDTGKDYAGDFSRMFSENKQDTEFTLLPGRYDFYVENAVQRSYSQSNT